MVGIEFLDWEKFVYSFIGLYFYTQLSSLQAAQNHNVAVSVTIFHPKCSKFYSQGRLRTDKMQNLRGSLPWLCKYEVVS